MDPCLPPCSNFIALVFNLDVGECVQVHMIDSRTEAMEIMKSCDVSMLYLPPYLVLRRFCIVDSSLYVTRSVDNRHRNVM